MSIEQQVLEQAETSVTNFATKFKREAIRKADDAAKALDSKAFNGKTPAQFLTDITALLSSHAANKTNPHNDTAVGIGSMSYSGYDAYAAGYLDQGVLPISCLGTSDYLPLGVGGSFEGATTSKNNIDGAVNWREFYQLCLEGDGTLVFLRNGTNGSSQGVYYGYVTAASDKFDATSRIVTTNQRYRPAVLAGQGGQEVAYIYQGGSSAVAGRIMDATGTLTDCFIAITQGSLDASKHLSVMLDAATWDAILNRSEVVVNKTQVIIIYNPYATFTGQARNDPVDFRVYTIPIAQFGTNALVTPTEVVFTDGSVGFNGSMYGETFIRIAAVAESATPNNSALLVHNNGGTLFSGGRQIVGSSRTMTFSAVNPNNDNEIRVLCAMNGRWTALGKSSQTTWIGFSFVITLGTNPKAVVDSTCQTGTLSLAADGTIAFGGNMLTGQLDLAILGGNYSDLSSRMYMSDNGIIFSSGISHTANNLDVLYRGKYNNFVNQFEALKYPLAPPETRYRLNVPVTFGSALGDQFDGFRLLPDCMAVVYGRNSDSSTAMMRYRFKSSGAPWATNYTYKSLDYITLAGYAPTMERYSETNIDNYRNQVIEVSDTDVVTSGSVLTTLNNQFSRYVSMASNGSVSGTISTTQSQLEALRDQLFGLLSTNTQNAGVKGVCHIELVVPQNSAIGAIGILTWFDNNNVRRMGLFSVGVSARSGAITLTAGGLISEGNLGTPGAGTGVVYSADALRQSVHWIYDAGDHWLIVGLSGGLYAFATGSLYGGYRMAVRKSDNAVVNVGYMSLSSGVVGQRFGAFPGLGVVSVIPVDYGTKLILRRMGKNLSEFQTWNINLTPISQSVTICSQEVASGWIVYFTEETPVMFSGREYILSPTSIDLRTQFTSYANKTFYVYARLVNGIPAWAVSETLIPESSAVIYVGTVVTGASAISAINVEKVTRLGMYRTSTKAAGSAIPVSSGEPEATAKLIW